MKVRLKPFMVPNFAVLQLDANVAGDGSGIPIKDLDSDALEQLAYQWIDALFAKAGKRNPFTIIKATAK